MYKYLLLVLFGCVTAFAQAKRPTPYNVFEFGAKGDGVTDDTAAIQRAFDNGSEVTFTPGLYKVTATLSNTSALKISGNATIFTPNALTNVLFVTKSGCTIEGLTIRNAWITNSASWPTNADSEIWHKSSAIFVKSATNVTIRDCTVSNSLTGIAFDLYANGFLVENCRLYGLYQLSDRGWMSTNAPWSANYYRYFGLCARDSDGHMKNNDVYGFGQGIAVFTQTGFYPSVEVTGNRLQQITDNGMYFVQGRQCTISDNIINGVGQNGIKVHGRGYSITGNSMTNVYVGVTYFPIGAIPAAGTEDYYASTNLAFHTFTNTAGIFTAWFNGGFGTISGNTFQNVGRHGISIPEATITGGPSGGDIGFCRGITVTGNTIRNFGGTEFNAHGIGLYGSDHIATGNLIDNSTCTQSFGIYVGYTPWTNRIGFKNFNISGNTITTTNAGDTPIYVYAAQDVTINNNSIQSKSSLAASVQYSSNVVVQGNFRRDTTGQFQFGFYGYPASTNANVSYIGGNIPPYNVVDTPATPVWLYSDGTTMRVNRLGPSDLAAAPDEHYPWLLGGNTNTYFGLEIYNFPSDPDNTGSTAQILMNVDGKFTRATAGVYSTNYNQSYDLNFRRGKFAIDAQHGSYFYGPSTGRVEFAFGSGAPTAWVSSSGFFINGNPVLTNAPAGSGSTNMIDSGTNVIAQGNFIATNGYVRDSVMPVNVKWFGAKGDGVTDDTAAIQSAINASPIAGTLYFPQSTYRMTSSVTNSRNVSLKGDSARILFTGINAAFYIGGTNLMSVLRDQTPILIQGMHFVDATNNNATASLYIQAGLTAATIQDCVFTNSVYGPTNAMVYLAGDNWHVDITKNKFFSHNSICVGMNTNYSVNSTQLRLVDNYLDGGSLAPGIVVYSASAIIKANKIEYFEPAIMLYGYTGQYAFGTMIEGNYFEGFSTNAVIGYLGDVYGVSILNNYANCHNGEDPGTGTVATSPFIAPWSTNSTFTSATIVGNNLVKLTNGIVSLNYAPYDMSIWGNKVATNYVFSENYKVYRTNDNYSFRVPNGFLEVGTPTNTIGAIVLYPYSFANNRFVVANYDDGSDGGVRFGIGAWPNNFTEYGRMIPYGTYGEWNFNGSVSIGTTNSIIDRYALYTVGGIKSGQGIGTIGLYTNQLSGGLTYLESNIGNYARLMALGQFSGDYGVLKLSSGKPFGGASNDTVTIDQLGVAVAGKISATTTNTAPELVATAGITLNGSRITAWPSGGGSSNITDSATNILVKGGIQANYLKVTNATASKLAVFDTTSTLTNGIHAESEMATIAYVDSLASSRQNYFPDLATAVASTNYLLSLSLQPTLTNKTVNSVGTGTYPFIFEATNNISVLDDGTMIVDADFSINAGTLTLVPEIYLATNRVTYWENTNGTAQSIAFTRTHYRWSIPSPTNAPITNIANVWLKFKCISQVSTPNLTMYSGGNAIDTLEIPTPVALASYQPANVTLSNLSALANASGYLNNDGSGTLSWSTPPGGSGSSNITDSATNILVKGNVLANSVTGTNGLVRGTDQVYAIAQDAISTTLFTNGNVITIAADNIVKNRSRIFLWEEFLNPPPSSGSFGNMELTRVVNGTGAVTSQGQATGADYTAPGVISLVSGTATNGYAGFMHDGSDFTLGQNNLYSFEARIRFGALFDGTDSAVVRLGFLDTATGTDGTDGVFFRYSQANTNWICVTRSNSTETASTTASIPAAGVWYRMGIVVNTNATSAIYTIDGTPVYTNTLNIPTGSSRQTGSGFWITKTAGSTSKTMYIDYMGMEITAGAGR